MTLTIKCTVFYCQGYSIDLEKEGEIRTLQIVLFPFQELQQKLPSF